MLLIMISDQYPIFMYYKVLEIYIEYFDSLDIMVLFSYPSSIVITRDYCIYVLVNFRAHIFCIQVEAHVPKSGLIR